MKTRLKTDAIYLAYLSGYAEGRHHSTEDDQGLAGGAAYALGRCDLRAVERLGGEVKPRKPREMRDVIPIVLRMVEAPPVPTSAEPEAPPEPSAIRFTFEGVRYRAPMAFEKLHVARLPDGRHVLAWGFMESYPPRPIAVQVLIAAPPRDLACDAVIDAGSVTL